MKFLSVLFLSSFLASAVALAADFQTGQAARITIGQTTFTSQDSGVSASSFGAVSGVAFANNTLFVVDSNHIQAEPVNNRVLIFNNVSRFVYPPTSDIPQGTRCPVCAGDPNIAAANVVLGQPDFISTNINLTQNGLRTPTGIATDGKILVVADTDNNRVLLWKNIPTSIYQNADLVLGQANFTTATPGVTATTMRGPQGVWIQGTRLFVADTYNHRVLVWNNIPTSNGQAADYVLGEPNLNSAPPGTTADLPPQANNLFAPVSVTSDGTRLFVTDLGHSRVLIWNSIPTTTQQPADLVVGQPDMTSEFDNNAKALCASNGTDSSNNPTFPARCANTLSFPRFALSDGKRLFIADGGNDRILVFNSIPTQNGAKADVILGQPDEFSELVTDSTDTFRPDSNILRSSPGTIRTPLSLAWDGANLYVSDPFDRRVLAFTIGETSVPINGITNAFSRAVFAVGSVTFGGTVKAADTATITITNAAGTSTDYTYTIVDKDTLTTIIQALADLINGKNSGTPDPNVTARPNPGFSELLLTSKLPGGDGNNVSYSVKTSTNAVITLTAASSLLSGGQNAAEVAPGSLVTIQGTNLSDTSAAGTPDSKGFYPTTLAGVTVYFDGIKAPLLFVSPTQINTQVPFELNDSSGTSVFVRTVHSDGSITNTAAIASPIVLDNPGILAKDGSDPRVAIAYHFSSNAIALVSVDGTIHAGDVATINIEDRSYNYPVQATDTLGTIRDGLIALINSNSDEKVIATPSQQFTRIILTAKVAGPDGNGIGIGGLNSANASVIITALNTSTCCASVAGARITPDSPVTPGEVITIFATGLGLVNGADGTPLGVTGQVFSGNSFNILSAPVDNAQVGGRTATVLDSGLLPGMIGVYQVDLQVGNDLPTNPNTQMFIAQSVFTSNIVTIPVVAPVPPGQ